MKIPKKHLGKHPRIMKREVKKHSGKEDSDASAYKDWDADYKSGKAGKGEKIPTKVSKYTKKYKEMFGESEEFQDQKNIINFDNFQEEIEKAAFEVFQSLSEEELNEGSASGSVDNPNSASHKALKKKSQKSGFPLGILKQVFKRGKSAWKKSHFAGVAPDQWAHARVNSFIVGGKTTKMHDKALYQRAKEAKAKKK
jgi:L-rhamnose mutarotase